MTDTNPRDLIKRLADALHDAADDVRGWGDYASSYFQKKHDLRGNVARIYAEAAEAYAYLSQPEPEGPTDEELLALMPESMRDEFSYAAKVSSDATGGQVKPGIFRVCLNHSALEYARAVLARWGRPVFRQKELTDEQLLKCFKIATPCYNMEDWRRELDGMRAAIAADRALCARLAVEPVPESPTDEEIEREAVANADTDDEYRAFKNGAFFVQERISRPAIKPEGTITEPRGCPTPGACSCPTAPYVPPELIRALELAEAALADISDTEREPWSEARAAQDLPRIRAVLARWGSPPQ